MSQEDRSHQSAAVQPAAEAKLNREQWVSYAVAVAGLSRRNEWPEHVDGMLEDRRSDPGSPE